MPVSGAKTTFDSQLLLRVLGFAAETTPAKQSLPGMVGESAALKEAIARAYRAARSEASILLYGESGTGKELAARAIHGGSSRAANPFVAVDCASLPENLLEAELFGYDKGAFTGAFKAKPGLMELAHHGTLFLDEIGEIPNSLQAKLLRALQEKEHRRLGGTQSIVFDARVIAATNRDLRQRVAEGSFREDLFFRLNVIPIRLPALRERTEDIGPITAHLVAKYCESDTGMLKTLDKEVLEAFQKYPWPGNVRELENVVRQMCIMADGPIVTAATCLTRSWRRHTTVRNPRPTAMTGYGISPSSRPGSAMSIGSRRPTCATCSSDAEAISRGPRKPPTSIARPSIACCEAQLATAEPSEDGAFRASRQSCCLDMGVEYYAQVIAPIINAFAR